MVGSDDLKTVDEKEGDGGDASNPTSQDNHSFMEGEEEEKSEVPPVRSIDLENKYMEEVSGDGERTHGVVIEDKGVVLIDEELKSERDFENKNAEETHDRPSTSSGRSSLDDEGQAVEEASVVELETAGEMDNSSALEGEPLVDLNENCDILSLPEEVNHVNGHARVEEIVLHVDVVPVIDPVNPDVSVNEKKFLETKNVNESVEKTMSIVNPIVSLNEKFLATENDDLCVEDTLTSDTSVPGLKENGEKVQAELDDSSPMKPVEMEVKMIKDEEIKEIIVPSLGAVNSTTKENGHELLSSSDAQTGSWNGAEETTTPEVDLALNRNVETVPPVAEGYKGMTLKTETCVAEETTNAEVNLASNETDGKVPFVSEGYEGVTSSEMDNCSKTNEGTPPPNTPFHENNSGTEVLQMGKTLEEKVDVLTPLEQDTVVYSSVIDPSPKEIEDKKLQSLNDLTTGRNNDAENTKDSAKSEGFRDQTPPVTTQLVAPLPKAQTSWMSCCGLFDLFTGSNR
ncbi:hypothetical protein RJ641_018000 [Dillenia turbinata]|uniref:Uncharacterized protein n=1 Tax=Dillenia turbinata TaxID=194707 RepID=A0AAN8YW42_9MAGN